MIEVKIKIDDRTFDRISHIEVRKRKDEIIAVEIPKAKQIECISSAGK